MARAALIAILRRIGMLVFLAISVAVYLAYQAGLNLLLAGTPFGGFFVVLALVMTFILRIDLLAACGAFLGAWQAWHWPMTSAMLACGAFILLSVLVNDGKLTKFKEFFRRVNRVETPIDAVAAEAKKKSKSKTD